ACAPAWLGRTARAGTVRRMPEIALRINGEGHRLGVDGGTALLDLLRENLGLTGAKKGCDHGQCGACTILLDGRRANACLALAVAHDGAELTPVEGLAAGGGRPPPAGGS